METISFKIEDFEGPLDLLLYLISKNKMDIYDVEIVSLIDQYIAVMQATGAYEMDSASEFIEMAARLVQMKSYLLLPKSEEAERMREELTGMLVEYSLCKKVAEELRTMSEGVYIAVRQPVAVELDNSYRLRHEPGVLENAYFNLMGRSVRRQKPQQQVFEPLVSTPFVSVTTRIVHVLRGLITGKIHSLKQLFIHTENRSQAVATFLAVLELVRAGRVTIDAKEGMAVKRQKTARGGADGN